jgi:hypothetical protein
MRFIALTFFLLLGCVGSGYVVDVADLTQAPDLDATALETGGLAVLGFVGELPDMHESHAKLSGELAHALALWLPNVPLEKPSSMHGPVFDVARERLSAGSLSDFPFAGLRELTDGKRFLVVAELRSNEVIHTEAESDDEDTYCTTRALRVRYRLIDLEQRRVAFQGVVGRRDKDCNEKPRSKSDNFLAAAIVDTLMGALLERYPAAPNSLWLVRKAARDFASLLPGAREPAEGAVVAKPAARPKARAPLPQAKHSGRTSPTS